MAEQALKFDDVKAGDEAPACSHKLTRTDLVKYAGASGDFNPMHTDEVSAQAAGLPSVFGHGMFTMGMLGTALTDYVGVGNLRRYKVRFTKQTWPGRGAHAPRSWSPASAKRTASSSSTSSARWPTADGEVKVAGYAVAVAV